MKNLHPYEDYILNEGLFGLGKEDREAKKILDLIKQGSVKIDSKVRELPNFPAKENPDVSSTWSLEISPEESKAMGLSPFYQLSLVWSRDKDLGEKFIVSLSRKKSPQDPNSESVKASKGILKNFLDEVGGSYKPGKLTTD